MEAAVTTRDGPTTQVAVDLGTRRAKVAVSHGGAVHVFPPGHPAGVPGPGRAALRALGEDAEGGSSAVARVLADVLVDGPDSVTQALGPIGSLVVAVPDRWYLDPFGVRARERLRKLVRHEHGLVLQRCLAQAEGAAAAVAAYGRMAGPVLVCDLGAGSATVTYCEIDGGRVDVVDLETDEDGATTQLLVGALAAAVEATGAREPGEIAESMLQTSTRRLALVAGRVAAQPRYRTTPALRTAGTALTACQVLECFQPVAAQLTRMVAALAGRCRPVADVRTVALAGGLADFPLTASAAATALNPDRPARVVVLGPAAVALGAAAVARGAVRLDTARQAALGLPVHQVRGGQLTADRVVLVSAGQPLPVDVERAGAPLVVEVGDLQPPSGAPLVLHVQRDGEWRPAAVRPDRPVPPGRYSAGLWPGFGTVAALVLRPLAGGDPLVYTIHDQAQPEVER